MQLAEMAGFFLAHAVWCISDRGPLIPMGALEQSDGTRELIRFDPKPPKTLQDGVDQGLAWLDRNPEAADRRVFIYDAFLTEANTRTASLILEARSGSAELNFRMAVPYRPADTDEGFAVHQPKILEHPEDTTNLKPLNEALSRGIASHEQGSEIWRACFQE